MIRVLSKNLLIRIFGPALTYFVLLSNGRYLDKTFFGEIILAISISNLILSFSSMGIAPLVIRNIANQFSIHKSNIFKLLIIIQTSIVFLTYLFIANNDNNNLNKIYIIFALPLIIGNYYCLKIRALDKIGIYNALQTLCIPLTQALLLIFYINVYEISLNQYLMFLSIPFLLFSWLISLQDINDKKRNTPNLGQLKTFFASSMIIGISALISSLNTNVDNLMITNICGVECLPEYRMHSIITRIGLLFITTYGIQIGNKFSRAYSAGEKKEFERILKYGFKFNAFYHLLTIPFCFLILPSFTNFLTNGNYSLSYSLIFCFVIASFIFGLVNLTIVGSIQIGLEKKIVIFNLISLLTNIAMNYLLIPKYGLLGAAIGTLTGSLVSLILCLNVLKIKINA